MLGHYIYIRENWKASEAGSASDSTAFSLQTPSIRRPSQIMKLSSFVFAAAALVSGVFAAPSASSESGVQELEARAGTPSSAGTHSGFYYSWWTDNQGTAYYTNENGGTYSLNWSGNGNLVGGKGWNPGTANR